MSIKLVGRIRRRPSIDNALKAADEIERLMEKLSEAKDGWYMANGVAGLAMKHRDLAESELESIKERLERCELSLRVYDRSGDSEYWLRYPNELTRATEAVSEQRGKRDD